MAQQIVSNSNPFHTRLTAEGAAALERLKRPERDERPEKVLPPKVPPAEEQPREIWANCLPQHRRIVEEQRRLTDNFSLTRERKGLLIPCNLSESYKYWGF